MGKIFDTIDERMREFIARQHVFFVATAPLAAQGHVNLSPKGLDSFAVLGPREVAYLDLVGSGAETLAHLRENGRITVMFCAFEGPPRILRLYGHGRALEPGEPGFDAARAQFAPREGTRAVIGVDVRRIADSCGYGVPLYHFASERSQLAAWVDRKGPHGLRAYQRENNLESLDGLPALRGEGL